MERELQTLLKNSSLHTLLLVAAKMLSRSGFGDIEFAGRLKRRDKSLDGGHELFCTGTLGSVQIRTVVKVVNDSVRLRMIDELAGTALRMRADFGVIVSTQHITAAALRFQFSHRPIRIVVIDGWEFAHSLRKLGIGVRPSGDVDYQFFGALELIQKQLFGAARRETHEP